MPRFSFPTLPILAALLLLLALGLGGAPALADWHEDVQSANNLARKRQYAQAIPLYERALKSEGISAHNRAVLHYNLGNCHVRSIGGSHAQRNAHQQAALSHFSQAVRLEPGMVKAHNNLGNLWRMQVEYTKALASYTQAIEADPKYAPPWRNRSIVHEKRHNLAQAISDDEHYLKLEPKDKREIKRLASLRAEALALERRRPQAFAQSQAGQAAMKKGAYKEAIEAFGKALSDRALPADARARTLANRGTCWYRMGHYKKAAAEYERATQADPRFAGAWRDLGTAHIRLSEYGQAVRCLSKALALEPGLNSARYNRALAYWSLKNWSKAEADLRAYIKDEPGDERAPRILRKVRARQAADYQ